MARLALLASAACFVACAAQPPTPVGTPIPVAPLGTSAEVELAAAPEIRTLDADTPIATSRGTTFTAAKGFLVTSFGDRVLLEDPDRKVRVAIVELAAASGEDAVRAAWKAFDPSFARASKQVTQPPARDGWDAVVRVDYDVAAAEGRLVIALARLHGTVWSIVLVDGDKGAFDKRAAQISNAVASMRPKGAAAEDLSGRSAAKLDEARLEKIAAFVEASIAKAKVPGAALGIVQGGKLVFAKGFGVKTQGKPAKVGPKTLFMIGSTTKSLTTLLLAKLVDEGKFDWTTKAKTVFPELALGDAAMTDALEVRHTVCACTGLPRQDMEFLFEYEGVTPEQRMAALHAMKPTTGFGETFQYSNVLVAAGGYLAARALDPKGKLGPAYDAAMKSRVFGPLGMTSTTFDFSAVAKKDHASPHPLDVDLAPVVVALKDEGGVVPVRPAGGAWSNVLDMSQWLLVELAKGVRDGKPIVSEKNLLARRAPQVKITDESAYGLGLFVGTDHGVPIVHHGGNNLGFTSDAFFLPEHDVGAVLLTNGGDANALRAAVRRRVLEVLFDAKEQAAQNLESALARRASAMATELGSVERAPDAAWVEKLAGTYVHATLGKVSIALQNGKAIFDAGEWKSAFGRKKDSDGAFVLVLLEPPLLGLELVPKDGKLVLDMPQQKYVFERTAEAKTAKAP